MFNLLWIVIGILFICCPNEYSRIYCFINFVVYIIFIIKFYRKTNKSNYWDFDTLFLLVFTVTSYIYPVFIYNESYPFLPFFNNEFNINDIPKGVIASTIAGCLYMQGSLSSKKNIIKIYNNRKTIKNLKLTIVALFLCALFFGVGGLDYYISNYNSFTTISGTARTALILQLEILAVTCIMSALGIELYRIPNNKCPSIFKLFIRFFKKHKFINRILLIVCLSFAISLAIVGNRTIGLAIIIAIIYIVAERFYNINLRTFALFIVIGFIAMFSIQITRAGYQFNFSDLAFDNVISDFIIPSRSNFLVYEVLEKKGVSLGATMLSPIITVIPTLDTFLDSIGINFESSPLYFTNYTKDMGIVVKTGLGTTLQADVMLAFGWPGLYLFYVLGKYVNTAFRKMHAGHLYYHIIYLCLISMSVYWVRAEFTYPVRLIVWSVVITYLCTLFKSNIKQQ